MVVKVCPVRNDLVMLVRSDLVSTRILVTKNHKVKQKNLCSLVGLLNEDASTKYRLVYVTSNIKIHLTHALYQSVCSLMSQNLRSDGSYHTFCTTKECLEKALIWDLVRRADYTIKGLENVSVSFDSCVSIFDRFIVDETTDSSTASLSMFKASICGGEYADFYKRSEEVDSSY